MINQSKNYRWLILILVVLTSMFGVAIPTMGMSVLSMEISQDLDLTEVQFGIVWGIGALPAIVTSLASGVIGDKIGPKRVLIVAGLLLGVLGAARGLAAGFVQMTAIVILFGLLTPFIIMNGVKTTGLWFPPRQLGLANGLLSMGMALGFLIGSMISATVLSPLLGSWRNVLILYGVLGALMSIPWLLTRNAPPAEPSAPSEQGVSVRRAVKHVLRTRDIWLLGLTLFGINGCIQGVLGYLPLYLRTIGWDPIYADGALSAFHTASLVFVLPIALWSDRLKSRKRLLLGAALMIMTGTSLLAVVRGSLIWPAVLMTGLVRDAFMAIFMTVVIETEGVGPTYAGTAVGLTIGISSIGNTVAPAIGNSLSAFSPSAPFAFWASLTVLGMGCLALIKSPVRSTEPIMLEAALEQCQVK